LPEWTGQAGFTHCFPRAGVIGGVGDIEVQIPTPAYSFQRSSAKKERRQDGKSGKARRICRKRRSEEGFGAGGRRHPAQTRAGKQVLRLRPLRIPAASSSTMRAPRSRFTQR